MPDWIFGKGERIAFSEFYPGEGPQGGLVHYTEKNYDVFYSSYGYCIPLSSVAPPIEYYLDKLIPSLGPNERPDDESFRYIRIAPNGMVLRVVIKPHASSENGNSYQAPIHDTKNGWWFVTNPEMNDEEYGNKDRFLGFLKTDPTEEQINQMYFRFNNGRKLHWMSVSDVVKWFEDLDKPDDKVEVPHHQV